MWGSLLQEGGMTTALGRHVSRAQEAARTPALPVLTGERIQLKGTASAKALKQGCTAQGPAKEQAAEAE